MTTKNKIAIIVSVLCLIVSVSIIAVISVWAATQHTVITTVSVTYTSHEIYGTAQANWIVGNTTTAMKDSKGNTTLVFDGEQEVSNVLTPDLAEDEYIELDDVNSYVVFEYIFTNKAPDHTYVAALTFDGTNKNVDKYWIESPTRITSDFEDSMATSTHTFTTTLSCTVPMHTGSSDGVKYVYILVKVQDINQGATFTGDFAWKLQGN